MAFSPLNQRLADQQRNRENRGRLAFAYARFTTEGMGTVEFEESLDFGLTFVERPFMSVGHQIDIDAARDAYGIVGDGDIKLPQVTGYVTEWDKTDRDHYVGCWVAVSVTYDVAYPVNTVVKIQHDFTFSAVAIKDIPVEP